MKLAIFLPNWLGDLVMATPGLRAVRRHFGPSARIVGILRPKLAGLLDGTDWLDEEWIFDPHGAARATAGGPSPVCRPALPAPPFRESGALRRASLVRRMRRERFDGALLLTNSLDTALLACLGGARRRIGYVRNWRGVLLTDRVSPRRRGRTIEPAPMVESYLALAEALGCPPEPPRLELALTEAEDRLGDQIWRNLGLRTDGRVVALNNSGAYGSAKCWPPEHCGALARRMAVELDHDVLVVCGPGEAALARQIVDLAASPRVFSLADQPLGLAATKVSLKRSRLTVSTDSGPRHVAAAFGRPVITLLGPTLPVWIDNPTVRGEMVRLPLNCLGCGKRVCPLGHHRCMRDLSPDLVFEAVERVLGAASASCLAGREAHVR